MASKRQHAKRGGGVGLATRGVVPPAGGVASGRGEVNAALRSSSPWPGSIPRVGSAPGARGVDPTVELTPRPGANSARGVSAGARGVVPTVELTLRPGANSTDWGQLGAGGVSPVSRRL